MLRTFVSIVDGHAAYRARRHWFERLQMLNPPISPALPTQILTNHLGAPPTVPGFGSGGIKSAL